MWYLGLIPALSRLLAIAEAHKDAAERERNSVENGKAAATPKQLVSESPRLVVQLWVQCASGAADSEVRAKQDGSDPAGNQGSMPVPTPRNTSAIEINRRTPVFGFNSDMHVPRSQEAARATAATKARLSPLVVGARVQTGAHKRGELEVAGNLKRLYELAGRESP